MPSLVGSGLAERPSRVERRPSLLEGYGKSSKAAGRVGSAHGPETHRAESPKLLAVFRRLRLGGGRQSPRRDGCAREACFNCRFNGAATVFAIGASNRTGGGHLVKAVRNAPPSVGSMDPTG
jgi:hypothetical protein